MFHATITNPGTGRKVKVRGWKVESREVLADLKAGKSAKDLSWKLLGDKDATEDMEEEEYGDEAGSNFALAVFEHALDWSLGLTVIGVIRAAAKRGKIPKPFAVLVDRKGATYVRFASGTVMLWSAA